MVALKLKNKLLSKDGTKKYIWQTSDGNNFETVVVNLEYRPVNYVICASTQLGCPVGCKFCNTGLSYIRNLTSTEIIEQITNVCEDIPQRPVPSNNHKYFEISFMAMGEPLLNWDNLLGALQFIDHKFNKNVDVTISSIGIIERIYQLTKLKYSFPLDLQISLHAVNNRLRRQIMPFSQKYSISALIDAGEYFSRLKNKKVCINYVLFKGLNDNDYDALKLLEILDKEHFYVKLSSYNCNDKNLFFSPSPEKTFKRFYNILVNGGLETKFFKSRGVDIGGGCGQLSSQRM